MGRYIHATLLSVFFFFSSQTALAEAYKVLVVMSYEEQNPWCQEIKNGVDAVLADSSDIQYFYMDTKVNPDGGPAKAEEALAAYNDLKPDGVITVDDNAQSMLVVPSLKDKVTTPIMFAGVNAPASKYGYPNQHISGILERAHVRESLAFAKQLIPSIYRACLVTNDVPSGRALKKQVAAQQSNYPIPAGEFFLASSAAQLDQLGSTMRQSCDVLFVDSLEGIKDSNQQSMSNRQVLGHLKTVFPGPILGGNRYTVEQGAWAAVVKTGREQGETAAEMLLKAMQGTPVEQIPVATNNKGERIVNVSALKANQVPLKPLVLRGATLVREQP